MLDVKTIEIAGFLSAVEALRFPFGKECRSETEYSDSWVENTSRTFKPIFECSLTKKTWY